MTQIHRFIFARALFSVAAIGLASACTPQSQVQPVTTGAGTAVKVTEIATKLAYPWGIAVLPDGSMLVTERDGRLRVIRDGKLAEAPIAGVPAVLNDGQGGLFDVALHPDFATNNLVYLSFAKGTKEANHTVIIRGIYDGARLNNIQTVFEAAPLKKGSAHFGGRMIFMPDKTLMLTLGDGYEYRDKAQDLGTNFGKIIRITDTGQPAPANPFIGQVGKRPEIYSYGHRNMQGLALDSSSGTLYEHEHGPKGGDEINIIQPGKNYGWPVITYGVDYSGAPISLKNKQDGMEQPITYWVPSIAPSGMAFYTGDLFPAWKGDLLVTALAGQQLRRVNLEKGVVASQETYLTDRDERYRHVVQAPDGSLLLLTDDAEGKVLRVTPG
jgi:aldose sugar dehydrogenase